MVEKTLPPGPGKFAGTSISVVFMREVKVTVLEEVDVPVLVLVLELVTVPVLELVLVFELVLELVLVFELVLELVLVFVFVELFPPVEAAIDAHWEIAACIVAPSEAQVLQQLCWSRDKRVTSTEFAGAPRFTKLFKLIVSRS
jgi:hypothetical protein